MSAEQDAGNNGKKLISIIGFGALVLLTAGYWLVSWLAHDPSGKDSAVNLNGTASSAVTTTTESPRYRELLKASNDLGAQEAARTDSSFIASLPVGLEVTEPPPDKPPVTKPASQDSPSPQSGKSSRRTENTAGEEQANEKRQAQLQKLLTRISAAQAGGDAPVLATALATVTRTSPESGAGRQAESTAKTENAQVFIPALTRASGYMETAVDSDNPNSEVVAVIPAGPLAGARLHSPSVKLAGNGLDIKFTSMSWKGMELNVKASAQSEKNLMSSIASDVNHRWGTHIVLPAVLGGLGDLGGLYKDANTQVMQSSVGTVTGRVGKPDGSTVAGVMVGGTAQTGAEVIKQEMAREPFRQVTVKQKEVISILFVESVTSDDIISNKKAALSAASTSAPTPVAAEQQTESRLQEAIARRQAEIRRQYGDTVPVRNNDESAN
ncbi:conjugal transfer protein TraO [Citrobacter freundii complex sp. 2024EL-00228]|jgi:intracellular multiplication protein IcmE|uniref:Conjugal transfer protein TraO n=2 Tax=Citrobacter freundii TaxID=546 RepID=A0A7W3FCT5_CITFR|nr:MULTISPECIES: conjugal transfer protein TraO [Citrobacter freundii complex]ELC6326244.1 conjugal transfer protein TraO [Enterobacter hormaechei]TRL71773.1 conjugal transfer protein TraO [Citrobacter youngae]EIC2134700.1 conjugal transfer protein TraO [Citrobacter freundii]EKU3685908.1 conjugal transfer protein TraO [Citrobacter freundii]EKU8529576.1 conjugal transfer protein TraO [Citrobacter freundii]